MAEQWIKIEHSTPDKPEVFRIANELGIDPDAVSGKLLRFWMWCDQQSVDGNGLSVTKTFLDRITHQPGFADAMQKVGWLEEKDGVLMVPNFDRHNGQTAKARATSNRRIAKHRGRGECNGASVTKALRKPLPDEDEDEDINTPIAPKGAREWAPSDLQKRLNRIFKRRDSTKWSGKERRAFKSIGEISTEDIDRLERYYAARIPDGKDYRRRDLTTLLNNFRGEVDRARNFKEHSLF